MVCSMLNYLLVAALALVIISVRSAPVSQEAPPVGPPDPLYDYSYNECPIIDCPIFYFDVLPCPYEDMTSSYIFLDGVECMACPECPDEPDPVTERSDDVEMTSLAATGTGTVPEEAVASTVQGASSFDATTNNSGDGALPTSEIDGETTELDDNEPGQSARRTSSGGFGSISNQLQSTFASIQRWLDNSARTFASLKSEIEEAERS